MASQTLPGLREAKAFVIVVVIGIYLPVCMFLVPAARPVRMAGVYVLTVALAAFAAAAFRLMMAGTARIPTNVFIAGTLITRGR